MASLLAKAKARMGLGTLLARQGLDAVALEHFQAAIRADSTMVEALARAGLYEALRYETAHQGIDHITRALELDPKGEILGTAAERLREIRDRAIAHMSSAEEDDETYDAGMAADDTLASGSSRAEDDLE